MLMRGSIVGPVSQSNKQNSNQNSHQIPLTNRILDGGATLLNH